MKNFILDTSVILENPLIISKLEGKIIIPFVVIVELENNKTREGITGKNARDAIRYLDNLRQQGSFRTGVKTEVGSLVVVKDSPEGTEGFLHDDIIIETAKGLTKVKKLNKILLTNDLAMRLKADAKGINSEGVFDKPDQSYVYSGDQTIDVDKELIDSFFTNHEIDIPEEHKDKLHPNEFVCMKSGQQGALGRVHLIDGEKIIKSQKSSQVCGIKSKNKEQDFALELLMDKDVHLVSMCGKAGCGKTFLALAAAFQQTIESKLYDRVIVMRPCVSVGNDIGYLPGSFEEKMAPWIQPIRDNLEVLLGGNKKSVDTLFENDSFQVEALTYIRGRSIQNSFIIVDEAQNLSLDEMKTILTRAGYGSKIILTGDVEQIDTHLDVRSNGLSKVVEAFKDYSIAGHITLKKGQRSPLATLSSDIL